MFMGLILPLFLNGMLTDICTKHTPVMFRHNLRTQHLDRKTSDSLYSDGEASLGESVPDGS